MENEDVTAVKREKFVQSSISSILLIYQLFLKLYLKSSTYLKKREIRTCWPYLLSNQFCPDAEHLEVNKNPFM